MLTSLKYAVWIFFLLGRFSPTSQISCVRLISKPAGFADVVAFAISAVYYISGKPSPKEKLLHDIKESINHAKPEILDNILLQSRFAKIDDAVRSIHSSLTNFEAYMEASTNETDARKQQYVRRFEDHSVISHINFLSRLLTYSIPGQTGTTVMKMFSENAACNKTKFENFETFYLHVISDGIALEVIHSEFKGFNSTKNLDIWVEKVGKIRKIFKKEKDACWCESNNAHEKIDSKGCNKTSSFILGIVLGVVFGLLESVFFLGCLSATNRDNYISPRRLEYFHETLVRCSPYQGGGMIATTSAAGIWYLNK